MLVSKKNGLYNVEWFVQQSLDSFSDQSRPRVYVTGVRKDLGTNLKFVPLAPIVSKPQFAARYFNTKPSQPTPSCTVARRNFEYAQEILRAHIATPSEPSSPVVIGDLAASPTFMQCQIWQSPCVTKSRASAFAFWAIMKSDNGQWYHRQLDCLDFFQLQGWPDELVSEILDHFSSTHKHGKLNDLAGAIGNGFHFVVMGRLLVQAVRMLSQSRVQDPWY